MSLDQDLEQLRRSLVMAPTDGPATALSNRQAAMLVGRVMALEQFREDVSELLMQTAPVPRANAHLRRVCGDLGRLLSNLEDRPAS